MRCPPEILPVILELLQIGILRIRAEGWAGRAENCAGEADHIHNLPDLISDYSDERLRYYWDVERPTYLGRLDGVTLAPWEHVWDRLSPFVESLTSTSSVMN